MHNSSFPTPGQLLPHKPPLVLLDSVTSFEADGVMAQATVNTEWPLFENGSVPVLVLVEILAQTAGLWAGWNKFKDSRPVSVGYLVGIKQVRFFCEWLPEDLFIKTRAKVIVSRYNFLVMQCDASSNDRKLTEARMQFAQGNLGG